MTIMQHPYYQDETNRPMGGRHTRLPAEPRIKRAAVYVVQAGDGATPTNTPR